MLAGIDAGSDERLHIQLKSAYVSIRQHTPADVRIRQLTSAYVSIRQHTPAYVSIRQHTSPYASIRQHPPAHVSICQHTSAYVSNTHTYHLGTRSPPAYVSIRQHTPAYVSIRQHTSAYVRIRQQYTHTPLRHALSARRWTFGRTGSRAYLHTLPYVSIRQHTSAYSIRQHTSGRWTFGKTGIRVSDLGFSSYTRKPRVARYIATIPIAAPICTYI
jgi:hypothetical protein